MTLRLRWPWIPAAGASVGTGLVIVLSPRVGLVGLVGAFGFVALWAVPRRYLGAIALGLYALLPVKFFPYPGDPGAVSPAIVVVCVWAVRLCIAGGLSQSPGTRQVVWRRVLLLTGGSSLAVLGSIGANHADHLGVTWGINYILLVLVPIFLVVADPTAKELVVRAWMTLSTALGAFAIVEAFVWHRNPIFGHLYASARIPLVQTWDVYRVTTSLGHPLVNGTFFACGLVIAVGRILNQRTTWATISLGTALVALFVTASRGPAVGAAVGVVVLLALSWGRRDIRATRAIAATGAVIAAAVLAATGVAAKAPLLERSQSAEGQSSLIYRQQTVIDGVKLARARPLFGWGPGHADSTLRLAQGRTGGSGLENGWIELLVGIGVVGAGLALCLILTAIATALRHGDGIAGALVVTLSVAVASFNFFDGQWPSMIMVGLVLGCAIAGTPPSTKSRV